MSPSFSPESIIIHELQVSFVLYRPIPVWDPCQYRPLITVFFLAVCSDPYSSRCVAYILDNLLLAKARGTLTSLPLVPRLSQSYPISLPRFLSLKLITVSSQTSTYSWSNSSCVIAAAISSCTKRPSCVSGNLLTAQFPSDAFCVRRMQTAQTRTFGCFVRWTFSGSPWLRSTNHCPCRSFFATVHDMSSIKCMSLTYLILCVCDYDLLSQYLLYCVFNIHISLFCYAIMPQHFFLE